MALCEADYYLIMKNIVINNSEVQAPQNKNSKTKLESQIEALKAQEQQITKQLKVSQTKAKKANNLANCLWTAEKFGEQFLAVALEKEKSQEQPDNWAWEYLIKDQTEFALKFEVGKEAFTQLIFQKIASQVNYLQDQLTNIQSQIQHQERKLARLQARRQGKVLLDCEYRKSLGCLGAYQCGNCQVNYSAVKSSQLEREIY